MGWLEFVWQGYAGVLFDLDLWACSGLSNTWLTQPTMAIFCTTLSVSLKFFTAPVHLQVHDVGLICFDFRCESS